MYTDYPEFIYNHKSLQSKDHAIFQRQFSGYIHGMLFFRPSDHTDSTISASRGRPLCDTVKENLLENSGITDTVMPPKTMAADTEPRKF